MATVSGGRRLEQALLDIAYRLGSNPQTLKVGFLQGATYPDGTPVALIAAIHNYGAPRANIPPRPFFSNMIRENAHKWPDAVSKNLKATNYSVDRTLHRLGEGIKGQLQQAIRDFAEVPLKPATIRRKGFDKQLIDTGHMLRSVAYKVED